MAIECKNINGKKLKMFGFGIPGQGFYAIDIPDVTVTITYATGLLSILFADASEEKIDKELKNLVRGDWDFKVQKLSTHEFLVVFPDNGSLETFATFFSFEMPVYGLKGKLEKTTLDLHSSSV